MTYSKISAKSFTNKLFAAILNKKVKKLSLFNS